MSELALIGLPLLIFWVCALAGATSTRGRAALAARTAGDWALDLTGLGVQGWLVPLGAAALSPILLHDLPAGSVHVGFWGALVVNLVLVDAAYWLSHRLLHLAWPVHRVHHGAPAMDTWVTARNTVWVTGLIAYPWCHLLFLRVLDAPDGYRAGAAITAALDLWRHSGLGGGLPGLVSPRHHAWHHSRDHHDVNFGANWSLWDRLAGTWYDPGGWPEHVGVPTGLPWARQLLWPFGARS